MNQRKIQLLLWHWRNPFRSTRQGFPKKKMEGAWAGGDTPSVCWTHLKF